MLYKENNYFNDVDWFLFMENNGRTFKSKCHLHKGSWYTNESLNYKCTSIMSKTDLWSFNP